MHALIHLDVIYTLKRTDVKTVENNLTLEFVPVLLDMVVLNHDDYHIHVSKEFIEGVILILGNLVTLEEWVVALERRAR